MSRFLEIKYFQTSWATWAGEWAEVQSTPRQAVKNERIVWKEVKVEGDDKHCTWGEKSSKFLTDQNSQLLAIIHC